VIAIDKAASRLEHAKQFGAGYTINADDDVDAALAELTDGQGVDVAIEAVGVPETFETCARIVRPGGVVANIGVHGASATLHLEELWIKNITITTGLVDTVTVPMLLQLVRDGRIRAEMFGTHDFALDKIMDAYDVFANAAEHNALKVVLKR
jgi:alcohol dehydrogenase